MLIAPTISIFLYFNEYSFSKNFVLKLSDPSTIISKLLITFLIFNFVIFSFNFKNYKEPCLRCFYQSEPSDELLNCETEGIVGTVANIIGGIQANEVLKNILNIKNDLDSSILIIDLLKLNFRKVNFKKKSKCICF